MKTITWIILMSLTQSYAADPSAIPLKDATGRKTYVERFRIVVDLDGDGTQDLILSDGPESFGKAGGPWSIYLSRNGAFKKSGDIFAHAKAISIEPDQDRNATNPEKVRFARIWVYLRGSGRSGSFGYFRVGENMVDDHHRLELYPGDGGTALGRAIYEATFKNSPIAFTVESSTTREDGTVTWSENH